MSGWLYVPLSSVSGFEGGSQPPKSEFVRELREGYIRLLQIRDFKSDAKAVYIPDDGKRRRCAEDDVMIGRYGASVGQIHRGKAGCYNVALIKTLPDPQKVDRDFFYHYLTSDLFQRPLMDCSSRGAQNGFNKTDISDFAFPLPPLEEQKRIVAVLDKAFAALDRARTLAEANLADAEALFEQELGQLFLSGKQGWKRGRVENLCTIKSGTTVAKSKEKPSGEVPYVKVADMNLDDNVGGIVTSSRFLDKHDVPDRNIIPVGATIFPKRGGAIMTNKKRLVLEGICADLNVMAVIPGEKVDASFLHFFFLSLDMRKIGSGSSIPQINNYDINPLKFLYPSDLGKQKEVAEALQILRDKSDTLCLNYQTKVRNIAELRQSLLQKAFAGELT